MSSKTHKWSTAKIGEIMNLVNGAAFKPSDWSSEGLPIIRIQNLNNHNAAFNYFNGQAPEKFRVKTNDLLFAWSGTPGTSFGAHIWTGGDAWLNQHIFRVEFDRDNLNPEFLRLAINQNLTEYVRQAHGGAGLAHITKGKFEESEIALPPLNEQRRIVAKLDTLFDKSRSIREKLDRLPRLLANLQKSILNAAFRGDLTKDWRANNPNTEPASVLLNRIRAERRARWEADLIAKGKDPKKAKYVEPEPVNTEGLPQLPEGWCWASVEEITVESRTGLVRGATEQNDQQRGYPYIRMQHYDERGEWHFTEVSWVEALDTEVMQFELQPGDLLFNTRNSRELVGKVAVWPPNKPGYLYNNNLLNLRFVHSVHSEFVGWQMIGPFFLEKLNGIKSATTSVAAIYQKDLLKQPVAIPPLLEQIAIAELVGKQIEAARRLEVNSEVGKQKCLLVEQSCLAKAFRGELVPQDPNDEPASVLLERIRAQKPAPGAKRGRGGKAPA